MAEAMGLCPFCGRDDLSLTESVFESGFFVSCNHCEAAGPSAPTKEEAVDRWVYRSGLPGEIPDWLIPDEQKM